MLQRTLCLLPCVLVISLAASATWYESYDFASRDVVAYWPFDNGALDYSGNANHGTLTGGSFLDGAVRLTPGQYITVPDSQSLREFSEYTMACWVRAYSVPGDGDYIFGRGMDGYPVNQYSLRMGPQGSGVNFTAIAYGQDSNLGTALNTSHALDTWYHLAAVYSADSLVLYVNGAPSYTVPGSGGLISTRPQDPLYFNRHDWWDNTASSSRLDCSIDDAVIFDTALTQEDIVALASDIDANGIADYWEPVPEPATMLMLGCLGAGMAAARRMKRRRSD